MLNWQNKTFDPLTIRNNEDKQQIFTLYNENDSSIIKAVKLILSIQFGLLLDTGA